MRTLSTIEEGQNNPLVLSLSLEILHPETGVDLQYSDLFVQLHIKETLDAEDDTVLVAGVFDSGLEKFIFEMTQEEADLLTGSKFWYYGVEIRLTDEDGIVLKRETFKRKIEKTVAK